MKKIPIIIFHSIAPRKNKKWYKSYLTLELIYFEDLIRYLSKKKYKFVFLDEYYELKTNNKSGKIICLTFDDGYLDNYVYAYPILKKYGAKGTIFVNPDFVQNNNFIRPTLENVWEGRATIQELSDLGFLSWNEMILMENSGVIDIQSHTLTHTKHFCSDKIIEFHNPNANYLYPISNIYPDKKPYYIENKDFKNLIPYGTPFFEMGSAVTAKRFFINEQFEDECVNILRDINWHKYSFNICIDKIKPVYECYKNNNNLIVYVESDKEYEIRIKDELSLSKKIIENKLNKKINYCCWPHGDYNIISHKIALESGYKATSVVISPGKINYSFERFDRTGSGKVWNSRFLTLLKAKYKIHSYENVFPYNHIQDLYYKIKY